MSDNQTFLLLLGPALALLSGVVFYLIGETAEMKVQRRRLIARFIHRPGAFHDR